MKVHLYHNKSSWNRDDDATPRFYLKPIKLLHIENVAFTKYAKENGYKEDGYRNWRWKGINKKLTSADVEKIYKDVQENYPYGYKENDPATFLKYELDIKQNEAFQAFYSRYWRTNSTKVKVPVEGEEENYPHPYIEFTVNEIVTVKYPAGKVPAMDSGDSPWVKYDTDTSHYNDPDEYSCYNEDVNIYVSTDDKLKFWVEGFPGYGLTVNSSGQSYNFHLKSGAGWPTGSNGALASGYKLAFSTGHDGVWNGYNDAEADGTNITVKRFASPSDTVTKWYLTVADKTASHPFYGEGSSKGFVVSGTEQSPALSLVRGNTYDFVQTGVSNSGHPLFISTDSGTAYTGIFSSGVWRPQASESGIGTVSFKVPYDAPDTLYYQCENHTHMGGTLNLTDPVAASGNMPGETIRVTFNQNVKDGEMFYYCSSGEGVNVGEADMGSYVWLKNECKGQEVSLTAGLLY